MDYITLKCAKTYIELKLRNIKFRTVGKASLNRGFLDIPVLMVVLLNQENNPQLRQLS